MSDKEWDLLSFETYFNLIRVFMVIGFIVGMFIFRINVLSGWHMPQDIKEGEGGPIIYVIVGFFTEFLPLLVAMVPGGIVGLGVGALGGLALTGVCMLLVRIFVAIQEASKIREYAKINKAKSNLLELCRKKESVIQEIQLLIKDKDCNNELSQFTKIFNFIGDSDIYDEYANKKIEAEYDVIEHAKQIPSKYGVKVNIESWSVSKLHEWCVLQSKKVDDVRSRIGDAGLLDLRNMIEEIKK